MALQDRPNRDRLPRGSNALEPEELARRHRERLQEALVVRVAANGLFDTTIRDICAEAQVATRDLYALYAGKDELLLATCDAIVARTSRQLDAARPQRGARTGSLRDALAETLDALAILIAAKPEHAHLVLIDVMGLGPRGLPYRRDLVTGLERVLFDAIAEAPGADAISEAAVQIVAGGFVHVAEHAVRTGQTRTLRTSVKHLATWAASYESAAPSPLPRPAIPARGTGSAATRPLPRSTQRLPRQFVVAHQRDRILEATMSLARDEGYAGITIPAISRRRRSPSARSTSTSRARTRPLWRPSTSPSAGSTRAPGRPRASRRPGPRRSVPDCAPGSRSSPPSPSSRASGSATC